MADKPTQFPHFAIDDIIAVSGQLNWAEPPQAVKDEGIGYITATARQHINWALRLCNFWIEWLEQEVVLNTGNIATNTSNISTNTGNISTNTSNISTNTSDIATNAANIVSVSNGVISNANDIASNTGLISTNAGNINTNEGNINTNTSDISTLNTNLNYADGSKNYDFSNISGGLELLEFTKVGRNVTAYLENFIGTTTAATMFLQAFPALDNFPASMRPRSYPLWIPCQVVVSGVERLGALRWVDLTQLQLYFLEVYESGGQYFNRLQPNFPIGASCGIREQSITYRSFD